MPISTSRSPQPLPPRAARGRILGYAVSVGSGQLLCNTSSTSCSVLVPPGVRILHVTAHNSRGASSPANVTLGREARQQGRISPTAALVISEIGFYQNLGGKTSRRHVGSKQEALCLGSVVSSRQDQRPLQMPQPHSPLPPKAAATRIADKNKNKLVLPVPGMAPGTQLPK